MRFAVVNLGCKVNRAESDDYEAYLQDAGYVQVEEACADVVIVNTCTVTGIAEKKTRKTIRQVLRTSPAASVIVTGCASAISPDFFRDLDERVVVVPKGEMMKYLEEFVETQSDDACADEPEAGEGDGALLLSRTRRGLKVQDGCSNACTYCIVHVARGAAVSIPVDEVLAGAQALMDEGAQEIVLTGINLGSYEYEGIDLTALLERLLDLARAHEEIHGGSIRFRVSSIEPNDVTEEFIALLARAGGAICRHLHLPLQAGSSKVLREMARPYDAYEYRALIDAIRAEVPEISLSTDIIVGFPGETHEEFLETVDLARYCEFSKIHVFPYSKREGTPAAARRDQVDSTEKFERAALLRQVSDELRAKDYDRRRGTFEYALIESDDQAMTESYHEIPAPAGALVGSLVAVTL